MALDIQMVGLLSNLRSTILLLLCQNLSRKLEEMQEQKLLKKKPTIPDLRITDKFVEDKKIIKENEMTA